MYPSITSISNFIRNVNYNESNNALLKFLYTH